MATSKTTQPKTAAEKKPTPIEEVKETATATAQHTYTQAEVEALIATALEKALSASKPKEESKNVSLLFQSEVSPMNYIEFGRDAKYGSITGSYGIIKVPKEAFMGDFRGAFERRLLETRELVVLDGLTDEEREQYGVAYSENETLPPQIFSKMLEHYELLYEVYPHLCEQYKDMVASRYAAAYEEKNPIVTREILVKLNELSKKRYENAADDDPRVRGDFIAIIEKMDANYAKSGKNK